MNLAVDAGGTNLRATLYKVGIHFKDFYAASASVGLASWIESILQEYPMVRTISISYAGMVQDGVIIAAPNINIDVFTIKTYFEDKYDVLLYIENDLSCAVLAEAQYYKSNNICALYVGTGLGLGVFAGGALLGGAHSMAAELGHIPYKSAPFVCGCGRSNCIELFASGSALHKWLAHNKSTCGANLQELRVSSAQSDRQIATDFEQALLFALGTAITLFDPEYLVLGGGVIEANPDLVTMLRSNCTDYVPSSIRKEVQIVQSQIKNAPLEGASLLGEYYGT